MGQDVPLCVRRGLGPLLGLVVLLAFACREADTPRSEMYGIGAFLGRADSASPVVVLKCIPHGPADRAGVIRGDCLLMLDDIEIGGWTIRQITSYILRDEPRPVRLTVSRAHSHLSFLVPTARISNIAAGAGLKLAWDHDSTSGYLVPLHELPPLRVGDAIGTLDLYNESCQRIHLRLPGDRETFLYFWASWCKPCKPFMKKLAELIAHKQLRNARVVGINLDKSCDVARKAISALAAPGEQYWSGGWHAEVPQMFRVYRRGIPCGALLDRTGTLLRTAAGADSLVRVVTSPSRAEGE